MVLSGELTLRIFSIYQRRTPWLQWAALCCVGTFLRTRRARPRGNRDFGRDTGVAFWSHFHKLDGLPEEKVCFSTSPHVYRWHNLSRSWAQDVSLIYVQVYIGWPFKITRSNSEKLSWVCQTLLILWERIRKWYSFLEYHVLFKNLSYPPSKGGLFPHQRLV